MPFSDDYRDSILDYVFSKATFTIPATIYVGLSTADPTGDGSGITEPTDAAYARVALTNNATNFPAASGAEKSNGTNILFDAATEEWDPITHVFFADAAEDGNMIGYIELDSSLEIGVGESASFPSEVLIMAIVDYPT